MIHRALLCILIVIAAGCGATARYPATAGTGTAPVLPAPERSLIPTVHVVDAKGWPEGAMPVPAPGTSVTPFAKGLQHPR